MAFNINLHNYPGRYLPFWICTDQQVIDVVDAYYEGWINPKDCWLPGDERIMPFAGTEATSTIEAAQPACNMPIRILGFTHDDLVTPINGVDKAAMTIEFVYSLPNKIAAWGKPGGKLSNYTVWYSTIEAYSSPLRAWLNSSDFRSAIPSLIDNNVKSVKKLTKSDHAGNELIQSEETWFFTSVYEVYADTDSFKQETTNGAVEGAQYDFYKNHSNIVLTDYYIGTSSKANRWTRSPSVTYSSENGYSWCCVASSTGAGRGNNKNAANKAGICPAFCL